MEMSQFPIYTEAMVVQKPKANFQLMPISLQDLRPDEVLVEMRYAGICHTDVALSQGMLPYTEFPAIFGHEGAGIVRAIGSDVKNQSLRCGDSVLLSFNVCGECIQCTSGHPAYCHDHPIINHSAVRRDGSTPGRLADGSSVRSQYFGQSSFARMSAVSEKCVVICPYPDCLSIYAPLGCGFQTGAGTILNVLKPNTSQTIVIFGMGSVGLAAVMAAKYLGAATIVVVDLVDEKLRMARKMGATYLINSQEVADPVQIVKEATGGGGADFAVDCTGVASVIQVLIECIGPRGVAAAVGVPPAGKKIEIDPLAFVLQNKTFVGIIEGDSVPSEFIPELIELHRHGHFPIEQLCKTYALQDFNTAMTDMEAGKVIKPVIEF